MRMHGVRRNALDIVRVSAIAIIVVVIATLALVLVDKTTPNANAGANRLSTPQVTLNPGGGILPNGSDGLRFTINADTNYYAEDYDGVMEGQDGVVYRGTRQYCCSAGGPMLNIGGTLYGQSGPALGSADWSSIQVIATSGAASVGTRTAATGNSGATVRYTVNHEGREYSIDRTVSYYYPNDYVTDTYSFVIPAGNTEEVKFYLGGDTAPGSSDSGYGIMLTEPVRSIISLNTYSNIMFGFREVQGSRPFDGATSQHYHTPYGTVQNGGDIGFVETASNHDAGLMMQWDLGSTPGTYTGSFEQFSTLQGTNLNATLAESFSEVEGVVDLNISIVNTELEGFTGLGYTITLPENLLIYDNAVSGCGGSLTATVGTGVIALSGVSIGAAANCVVSVPVTSAIPGSYSITQASATGLTGVLANNVGTSTLHVGVYPLSYATQGGTVVDDVAVALGTTVIVPSTTRAGYTFIEWNTAPDGSGISYAPGAEFMMPAAATTLYARWEYIPYVVTFDTQGGQPMAAMTNLAAGTDVELPGAERDGYYFMGWNTLANGFGTSFDEGDTYTVPVDGATLYAVWTREVTITFDGQDGNYLNEWTQFSGNMFWTPYAPERAGYTFIEWNTSKLGTGTGYAEETQEIVPGENTVYYAIWEDNDGIGITTENQAPNGGDGNDDGMPDSQQADVASFVNQVTGNPITLSATSEDGPCYLTGVSVAHANSLGNDPAYVYPYGLLDFVVECGDPGFTATITQYFYEPAAGEFILRKYGNGQFATINGATFEKQTIDGRSVLIVRYDVTDGGLLDEDGEPNGVIVDPAGPALILSSSNVGAPDTGLEKQSEGSFIISLVAAGVLLFGIVILRQKEHALSSPNR